MSRHKNQTTVELWKLLTRSEMARFCLVACATGTVLMFSLLLLERTAIWTNFISGTAKVGGGLLRLCGQQASTAGASVSLDSFSLQVVSECTGALPMVILAACVLAYPSRLRSKLWGLLFGAIALYLMNIVRIASMAVVGLHWPQHFNLVHRYLWQGTSIAFIALLWIAWLVLAKRQS